MKTIKALIIIVVLVSIAFYSYNDKAAKNCSTFMFKSESAIFVGHNLDETPGFHVPGMICINPRGIYREGITWYELIADPDIYEKGMIPFDEKPEPKINWVSKYGSVTFNSEGIDFPDGGINEKGLTIFEMSMGRTEFTTDSTKPTLFITLWIQYQLDNYSNVYEVVKNIHNINQQGWSWHYFVSDRTGDFALIEYINGEVVIHKDENAPYPILCNSEYTVELERVEEYDGFFADIMSYIISPPRFVRANNMLIDYDSSAHRSQKKYALEILDEIKINGWNKWGIIIDVTNMIIYFHTNKNRDIRYFSFNNFDYSKGQCSKMLNIYNQLSGEVSSAFEDYSYNQNLKLTKERANLLFIDRFTGLIDNGVTPDVYATRFADYSEKIRKKSSNEN